MGITYNAMGLTFKSNRIGFNSANKTDMSTLIPPIHIARYYAMNVLKRHYAKAVKRRVTGLDPTMRTHKNASNSNGCCRRKDFFLISTGSVATATTHEYGNWGTVGPLQSLHIVSRSRHYLIYQSGYVTSQFARSSSPFPCILEVFSWSSAIGYNPVENSI